MKIKNQFLISIAIFIIVLAAIAASVITTEQQTFQLNSQDAIARDVQNRASNLNYISNDYFLYQNNASLGLWQTQLSALSTDLAKLNSTNNQQIALVNNVNDDLQNSNNVFASAVSFLENAPRNESVRVLPEFQTEWSRLAVENQALTFDAQQLTQNLRSQVDQSNFNDILLIVAFLGLFGTYFITNYLITYRNTLKSIYELQEGIAVVGSGNLDYPLKAGKKDEISEIASSFNQMAANLKTVTASKADLELAQGALVKSEQRWATTLSSIGDAVIATDVDGKITFMNKVAESLTAFSLAEAIQKPLPEIFHIINEETRREVENPVEKVLQRGAVVGLANHSVLINKQGGEIPVDDSGSPIRDKNGQVTGVVLVFHNITERKKTEDELKRQTSTRQGRNQILQAVLSEQTEEALGEACLSVAEEITGSKFGFIGEIYENRLRNIAISNPGREACVMYDQRGHRQAPGNFKIHGIYGRVLTDGKSFFTNDPSNHPDSIGTPPGHPSLKSFLGVPLKTKDETIGMLAVANREGGYTQSDLESLESLTPVIVEAFARKRAEVSLQRSEAVARQRAEELEKLQVKLEEKAAELEEYATNMENLAEQRALQLKDAERLAAIGSTAGMVGHDIRNPLQAITGDVYLAKSELAGLPDSEEKKSILESLEETEKNVEYINKIVADLQDFARPLNPRVQESNMKALVEEMIGKNGVPKNIKVSVKAQNEAQFVKADPDYLKRIVGNLVLNAVQAMPEGGKLSVRIFKDRQTGDALLTVEDTGVGIPDDVKGKLFTPMFTTKSKGQGFGLAVVKRMTEALGGTVTFESEHGKGSKFIVRLPPRK